MVDRPVEVIMAFIQPQRMKLLAALLNDLGDRGPGTATLVAQQREQSHRGTADFFREIDKRSHVKWGEQHRQSRYQHYSGPNYLIRANLQIEVGHPKVSDGHG